MILSCKSDEEKYWDSIIDAFKEHSIYSSKIQWDKFRQEVKDAAKVSKYKGLDKALTLNRNKHTFFLIGEQKLRGNIRLDEDVDYCLYEHGKITRLIGRSAGYLEIPSLFLDPGKPNPLKDLEASAYVKRIHNEIKRQDQQDPMGWIIDLRFNNGGNMWPMLMALAPFFEDSTLGYFVSVHEEISWNIDGGRVYSDGNDFNDLFQIEPINYQLKSKDEPVIVLISNQTSSAGEAIAIAFKSHPNACFLGDDTSGYATGNKVIPIASQEFLVITNSVMADHSHMQYWDGVKADFIECNEYRLSQRIIRYFTDQVL